MFYFPVIAPLVSVSLLWQWMFNTHFGVINSLLRLIGLAPCPMVNQLQVCPYGGHDNECMEDYRLEHGRFPGWAAGESHHRTTRLPKLMVQTAGNVHVILRCHFCVP